MADPAAELLAQYRAVAASEEVKKIADLPKVYDTPKGKFQVPYYTGVPIDLWPPERPAMSEKIDTGVYDIYAGTLLINGEDSGISETYLYAVSEVTKPYEDVSLALAKVARARLKCMSNKCEIVATRVSNVAKNVDSEPHTGEKYGCGTGVKSGAVAPMRDCFRLLFSDGDWNVKSIRHFGACAVASLSLATSSKRSRGDYAADVTTFADELQTVYIGQQQPSNKLGSIFPVVQGYDREIAENLSAFVSSVTIDANGHIVAHITGVDGTFGVGAHVHLSHQRKPYIRGLAGDYRVLDKQTVGGNTEVTLNGKVNFPATSLAGLTATLEKRVPAYYKVGDVRLFLYGRRPVGRPFFLDAGHRKGK